jgi:hypothetical protein
LCGTGAHRDGLSDSNNLSLRRSSNLSGKLIGSILEKLETGMQPAMTLHLHASFSFFSTARNARVFLPSIVSFRTVTVDSACHCPRSFDHTGPPPATEHQPSELRIACAAADPLLLNTRRSKQNRMLAVGMKSPNTGAKTIKQKKRLFFF